MNNGAASVPAVVRAIGNDLDPWLVEDGAARFTLYPDPVLRLSTLAMGDAVLAGAGAALLPRFFVRNNIESGRLVSWGVLAGRPLEMWILHASARLASTKMRVFMQFLAQSFPDGSHDSLQLGQD